MKKVSYILIFICCLSVNLPFLDQVSYAANIEDLKDGVVYIKAFSGAKELGKGAGIVVGKEDDGSVFILTAYHVIEKSNRLEVRFKKRQWKAYDEGKLYDKFDEELDVAVVIIKLEKGDKIYEGLPELPKGDLSQIANGDNVTSIGHPEGGERWEATFNLNRILNLSHLNDLRKLRATRTSISNGCSGGPLFDAQLNLIGMITRINASGSVATKINYLLELLDTHWGIPTNLVKSSPPKGKTPSPQPDGITPGSILPKTVQGKVLWNENPVKGATVSVYDKYTVKSAKYGEAKTDNHGNFLISGIPEGKQYLYVFGNKNEFWVSSVTPFQMEKGKGTEAKDTYLCKGFYPISPIKDAIIHTKRPILKWKPYPDAVDYAVRLIRVGDSRFIFSRGDNDSRITKTQVQLDIDLTPGKYRWRVDAFNVEGHIIGCSYYSASKFKVSF